MCLLWKVLYEKCILVSNSQLGEAVTKNPGYLKLRRIRAAQNIAKTVQLWFTSFHSYVAFCLFIIFNEFSWCKWFSLDKGVFHQCKYLMFTSSSAKVRLVTHQSFWKKLNVLCPFWKPWPDEGCFPGGSFTEQGVPELR